MDEPSKPTLIKEAVFLTKSTLLKVQRSIQDTRFPTPSHSQTEGGDYLFSIAESITPLWVDEMLSERSLQLGKVHNLRIATRHLQHIEVRAGSMFSFWKQIGRATRGRGYVDGRQISEGCLVPAIGGGLCQLSNALYDVALKMGADIIERHPHTRVVPGSVAEQGRDATVYWNYLDLRFRPQKDIVLHAELTADSLIVRVSSREALPQKVSATALIQLTSPPRETIDVAAHSCQSCGRTSCFRHKTTLPSTLYNENEVRRTAFLLEESWAEFEEYVQSLYQKHDIVCLPLDGRRWKRPHYVWGLPEYTEIHTATLETLRRAYQVRALAEQGAERQTALLAGSKALAKAYARSLTPDITHLCIALPLLPFLWHEGHLGGRTFDVLMTRRSLTELHTDLDAALKRFPERATLGDFRSPFWLQSAEALALSAARQWVTPHRFLVNRSPHRTLPLEWKLPNATPSPSTGKTILFPGPTVARKGAFEVREAVKRGGWKLRTLGRDLEGEDFWEGILVTRASRADSFWQDIGCVVQPALIEDKPRILLEAMARGIPVIATQECGLPSSNGWYPVEFGDSEMLYEALREVLSLD